MNTIPIQIVFILEKKNRIQLWNVNCMQNLKVFELSWHHPFWHFLIWEKKKPDKFEKVAQISPSNSHISHIRYCHITKGEARQVSNWSLSAPLSFLTLRNENKNLQEAQHLLPQLWGMAWTGGLHCYHPRGDPHDTSARHRWECLRILPQISSQGKEQVAHFLLSFHLLCTFNMH